MRAFRPSHFSQEEDYNEDADRAKQDNLRIYTQRAQAGLPLFTAIAQEMSPPAKTLVVSG